MTKIVILVDGGNVQAVFSDGEPRSIEVKVVDFDNLDAEGHTSNSCEHVLMDATMGMTAIY